MKSSTCDMCTLSAQLYHMCMLWYTLDSQHVKKCSWRESFRPDSRTWDIKRLCFPLVSWSLWKACRENKQSETWKKEKTWSFNKKKTKGKLKTKKNARFCLCFTLFFFETTPVGEPDFFCFGQWNVRAWRTLFEPGADAPGSNTISHTLSDGLILTQEYN